MSSRRNYITADEVNELAGFTPTDAEISEAEEIIDAYVGQQDRFYTQELRGRATAGGTNTINLQDDHVNIYENDYFKLCEVEIIAGTGSGQRKTILSSTKAGVITTQSNWTTAPDSTSIYRIYQLGKFPRHRDVFYFTDSEPYQYAKAIPEKVKRATAMQCQYMHEMGDSMFATDKADKIRETIGDYEYENAKAGAARLIAPRAKVLLNGIRNITGEIV